MSRWNVINNIKTLINAVSYLEIGCCADECFSKISLIDKVGVDPKSGGTHRMTSDVFFETNKRQFDLIFIDGLHLYDQVLRDIENSLAVLNSGGVILVHDSVPSNELQQTVPRPIITRPIGWTGDVWKAVTDIRSRVDIDVCTVEYGTGITVIKKRPNAKRLPLINQQVLTWDYFVSNKSNILNIMPLNQLNAWVID